jgi:nickel transport protein
MRYTKLTALLIGTLLASASGVARPHGIWFAPRVGEIAIVYGHGAEDLNVVKRKDKLGPVKGFDGAGGRVPTSFKVTDHLLFVDTSGAPSFVAATMDNGVWTKGADDKWSNKGKNEVPNSKVSGRYLKYAVHILGELRQPMPALEGQTLQIVPMTSPLPQHAGMPLRLKVLFEGKPVQGALVGSDNVGDPDAKPRVTSKDGTVSIRVRNQGLNVISATYNSPPEDPLTSSKTEHFATLSFVLKHMPE